MDESKFYKDGPLCFRGHGPLRYKSTGQCYYCMRQRYQDNKEKHREEMRRNYFELGGREARKERDKANREKIRQQKAEWRRNNPEKVKAQKRETYLRNKESISEKIKQYRKSDAGKKSRMNERANAREKAPWVIAMRSCFNTMIRRRGMAKNGKTEELLGYSFDQFKKRIEFNFQPGMTWENHGEWHVDHTKPVSRFVNQGCTNVRMINCLSNLRPLWAADNIKKGDTWHGTKS